MVCNHCVSLLNLSFLARSERSSLNLLVEDQGTCVGSTLYVVRRIQLV